MFKCIANRLVRGLVSTDMMANPAQLLQLRFQEFDKRSHSLAVLGGNIKYPNPQSHGLQIALHCRHVESHSLCEVGLGDNGKIRAIENRGIFQVFVFALGDRHQNETRIHAQIVRGRTNKIADVFDE